MSSSDDPLLHHHSHSLLFDQHSRSFTTGPAGHPQIHPSQPATFSLTLSPASLLPLGPFTGYASVLNRSRFLNPVQQLLEEACHVGSCGASPLAADPPEVLNEVVPEEHWKKARLVSMINEVCRRYRMYYQQIQNVITSFERVAGLSTAAPYVLLALSSLSKHFRCLKNTICSQLNRIDKNSGKDAAISRAETSSFGMRPQQYGSDPNAYTQAHVWRPQRGLPERAVAVLRAWLFEHFLHPYPTDVDKQMLAKQTGLTRNQVSNWFINARVRLWKPMVEEIHNLEMRELQKTKVADINSNNNDNNNNNNNNNKNNTKTDHKRAPQPSSSTATCSTRFVQRNQNPSARISLSNELSNYIAHNSIEEPFNYSHNEYFSGHDIGRSAGSVSLTLGLHQNVTSRLPEPLSLNMALQFGIEDCNDAYVVGAFEGHYDRRFGKDMISGHLMHDFVG